MQNVNRRTAITAAIGALAAFNPLSNALAHGPVDDHDHAEAEPKEDVKHVQLVAQGDDSDPKTSGQGSMVFSWDQDLTGAFPEDAKKHEPGMHGGFTENPETGEIYTGIPGAGFYKISPDLKTWEKIGDDPRLKDNIHGIHFFEHKGSKMIALAQNNKRVLVVNTDGGIISEINQPKGTEFSFDAANEYFGGKSGKKLNFSPTDVTYLDGTLYVAHGYSAGDFVLTIDDMDGDWMWGSTAWGGKGNKPGEFNTAHGITAHEGHLLVSNREAHRVDKYTPEGKFVESLPDIPKGSRICNIAHEGEHFFMNPLAPLNGEKSARVYVHTGEELVSTIVPADLDIPVLKNIHQVWPHEIENDDGSKELVILVHGWNKGKFAVLRHEPDAEVLPRKDAKAKPSTTVAPTPE